MREIGYAIPRLRAARTSRGPLLHARSCRLALDSDGQSRRPPIGERYGWHSLRSKFASEMKEMPLRDLCDVRLRPRATSQRVQRLAPDQWP